MGDGVGVENTVETTGLAWGVRSSFRRYVTRVALGQETAEGNAGMLPDGRFYFPVESVERLDVAAVDADIRFGGGIWFYGHAGSIDLRLSQFRLHLTAGAGVVRALTHGGDYEDLVDVALASAADASGTYTLVLTSALAAGAEHLFDEVYAAETPFDDLEIRVRVSGELTTPTAE